MSKRGMFALGIVLVVLLFALIGLVAVMNETSTTGMDVTPPEYQPGRVRLAMLDCQSYCFGRPVGVPRVPGYGRRPLSGAALKQCLAECQAELVPQPTRYA